MGGHLSSFIFFSLSLTFSANNVVIFESCIDESCIDDLTLESGNCVTLLYDVDTETDC